MKKLIFINCILALAVVFTYCSKSDVQEDVTGVDTTNVASNRVPCTLSSVGPVFNATTLSICGTNTNLQNCVSCLVANPIGLETFQGPFSLVLQAPISFTITSSLATTLNLTAGNGQLPPTTFTAGQCRRFYIDANCRITEI